MNLLSKFTYYRRKYGVLHTVCSYVGRHNISIWKLIGPVVTHSYLRNWLAMTDHRILNLGGGSNCLDEYLTVDIDPRADAYVDITKRLPFDDASIDAIFCEEVIEHIDLNLGRNLLRECWRILMPGGVLRIITPSLDWLADRASSSLSACDDINAIFYCHEHRYLYTEQSLKFYCVEVGFVNLKVSSYQDTNSKLGYLDSHPKRFNHLPEISQYLEMEKPKPVSND